MLPRDKDYARVKRRLELAAERPAAGVDAVIRSFVDATADVLDIRSACWHPTDPGLGSPLTGGEVGGAPGSLEEALQYEYRRRDVNSFHELQGRGVTVASISAATAGRPRESLRFREMIGPAGPADELRTVFRDAFGLWACLVAFTGRPLEERDLAFVAEVTPTVTRALREATAIENAQPRAPDPEDTAGPSVLLLDGEDRILAADAVARRRLALLPEHRPVEVPGVIAFLAARARHSHEARASARTRTIDGRWFTLDASRMDDTPGGSVAVVLQSADPAAILDNVLRGLGLTAREREVATLAAQGQSTKAIAQTLVLSPWTVQDHLKAVFEKTGFSARSDLSALASVSPAQNGS
jgi:DNA-binding CsgD family transcriptional regulator